MASQLIQNKNWQLQNHLQGPLWFTLQDPHAHLPSLPDAISYEPFIPWSLCSSHIGIRWFLEGMRHTPASGPLHLLIILLFSIYPSLSFTSSRYLFKYWLLSPTPNPLFLVSSLCISLPPPYLNGLWGLYSILAHLQLMESWGPIFFTSLFHFCLQTKQYFQNSSFYWNFLSNAANSNPNLAFSYPNSSPRPTVGK